MGQACSIAATMDPHGDEFKANMDSLNAFMRERGLPRSLKVALRTYFHNSRRLQRAHTERHLVEMMSPLMASTVALQANKTWLDHIWFLRAEWHVGDAELVQLKETGGIAVVPGPEFLYLSVHLRRTRRP